MAKRSDMGANLAHCITEAGAEALGTLGLRSPSSTMNPASTTVGAALTWRYPRRSGSRVMTA
jgi:hypothetical protein